MRVRSLTTVILGVMLTISGLSAVCQGQEFQKSLIQLTFDPSVDYYPS